jgi:hypothetical protein
MRTAVGGRIVVGLLTGVLLAACGSHEANGQIDGWAIAEEEPCAPNDAQCLEMIEVATKRLDGRDAGHAPIVKVSVHAEGLYPDDDGDMGQLFRSGGFPTVIVFVLADGSRRAIGVKYVLNDEVPTTYDHGPERLPGGGGDDPAPAPTI